MKLENDFEVPASINDVWPYLLDVERVVPCMPGAKLTETVDDDHFKGQLTLKLGPVKLTFAGKVDVLERDEAGHRMVFKGRGTEQKGKGAAQATITVMLSEVGSGGTKVAVEQDLQVSGQAAQLSRGMMQDVSSKLTRQFAECLKSNIESGDGSPDDAVLSDAGVTPATVAGSRTSAAGASKRATSAPGAGTENAAAGPEEATSAPAVRSETAAAGASGEATPPSESQAPRSRVTHTAPDEISVAGVGFGALWAAIKRLFGRLSGRGPKR